VTNKTLPLRAFADRSDALLHYIPLLRKANAAMPADDPQEHEDEHVKQVKEKTEKQKQPDGR
jgi:hypothetical protein